MTAQLAHLLSPSTDSFIIYEMQRIYAKKCVEELEKGREVHLTDKMRIRCLVTELSPKSQGQIATHMGERVSTPLNLLIVKKLIEQAFETSTTRRDKILKYDMLGKNHLTIKISPNPRAVFLKQETCPFVFENINLIYVNKCIEELHRKEVVTLYVRETCRIKCSIEELTSKSQQLLKEKGIQARFVSIESDGSSIAERIRKAWENKDVSQGKLLGKCELFSKGEKIRDRETLCFLAMEG